MPSKFFKAIFFGLFIILHASAAFGYELKTEYATVIYEKEDLLRRFNNEVSLGSLSYLLRNRKSVTADDEAGNKIDVLVERVETILDMFPGRLRFTVVLLSSQSELQKIFRSKYGTGTNFIAFYSPKEKTVYISVKDIRVGVLAHELTHVVLDNYFGVSPPTKIHEVLAQFVETHLRD